MAHFAKLSKDTLMVDGIGTVRTVESVIVLNNEDCLDDKDVENEEIGKDFIKNQLKADELHIQTSYNSKIRKNYAYVGGYYSESLDAFINPKPESNPLDENGDELSGEWALSFRTARWIFNSK